MSKPTYTDKITGKPQHANGGTIDNNRGKPKHGRDISRELDKFAKESRK